MTPQEALPTAIELASRLTPMQALLVIVLFPVGLMIYVLLYRRDAKPDPAAPTADMSMAMKVLFDGMQAELVRVRAVVERYSDELELLRAARSTLEAQMRRLLDHAGELADAALAGRVMVHDLERRMQLPETPFPPLPTLPTGNLVAS